PEPQQRRVQLGQQRPSSGVTNAFAVPEPQPRLGGDHQVVPGDEVADHGAQDLLAHTAGVGICCVHQGPAGVDELGELLAGFVLVGVPPPGHRAQTQSRHPEPGSSHVTLAHVRKASPTAQPADGRLAPQSRTPGRRRGSHRPARVTEEPRMRLGVNVGYVAGPDAADRVETAVYAESLGYSVVWAAEAYGSDAPTLLSWIGARTHRIDLGSAIMQIPARTPAMTAMTAATLDRLSSGRFRLGLGVSGPQVSEGWHGVRFDHPLGRTREYVAIVQQALRRETLAYEGTHFTLPLPDGPGKPL